MQSELNKRSRCCDATVARIQCGDREPVHVCAACHMDCMFIIVDADTRPAAPDTVSVERQRVEEIASHGQFVSDVCYAAFGHRDTLTYDQILATLTMMRKDLTAAATRIDALERAMA